MLAKIDHWLIHHLYQGLVDATQRKPAWWIEQCGFMLFVFGMLRHFLKPSPLMTLDYIVMVIDLLIASGAFWYSRMPALIQSLAESHQLRMAMLVLSVLGVLLSLNKPWGILVARTIFELALVSVYYFAACKPPRPKVPRGHLVPDT